MARTKKPIDEHWKHWTKAWQDHVILHTGFKPMFKGPTLTGLKDIRTFFLSQVNRKTDVNYTEEEALHCFQYILNNWKRLPKFKQQLAPAFIASRISDYIVDLGGSLGKMAEIEANTKQIQDLGYDYFKNS